VAKKASSCTLMRLVPSRWLDVHGLPTNVAPSSRRTWEPIKVAVATGTGVPAKGSSALCAEI
jgi:hypothetical protein